MPMYRGGAVVQLELPPEAGVVKVTSPNGHVAWWRKAGFDPVPLCRAVGED
jgi:hypothetical protein